MIKYYMVNIFRYGTTFVVTPKWPPYWISRWRLPKILMTDISGYVPAIYLILVSRCTNVRPRNLIVVMKHILIHIIN